MTSNPKLIPVVRCWWHEQRRNSTALVSFNRLLALVWEFVRGSLPEQRRRRYGDVEYDWKVRMDTTSATVSWRSRLLGLLNSPYQPIPPAQFKEMISALEIDFSRFTFIDIGFGQRAGVAAGIRI